MFRVHLFFQYAEPRRFDLGKVRFRMCFESICYFNMPRKLTQLGVSFFSINEKFRYVRAIWQSLKEILSLENSKFIKGTQSNIRVGAVDLGITLHLGC